MQRLNMDRVAAKFAEKAHAVTASIHDYQQITPQLVKVVATFSTLDASETQLNTALARLFGGNARPVEGSFRQLRGSSVPAAVGFVCANTIVKEYDSAEVASMKVLASNLLMSAEDESLWEVRSSGNAKYLAKQTQDDLSELVALAKVRSVNTPKLSSIAVASVQQSEFVAFVDKATLDMRYGFVVKASEDTMTVVDTEGDEVEVDNETLVESAFLNGDDKEYAEKAGIELPAQGDKQAMIDYYREVYSYDKDYADMLVSIINQHAAL